MALKDLGYKPRESSVRIIMDDALRQAVDAATAAMTLYATKSDPDLSEGQQRHQELKDAEEAADAAAVTFRFRALSRTKIAELVAACPPTEDQLNRWKEQARAQPLVAQSAPEFDWDAFAPKLIAASMIEPETSIDEVQAMWDDPDGWSDAIWEALWQTGWAVNQQISTRPTYGTGSEKT